MDFRSLRYVLEVAEQQSFSKAAEKLYIAQPSLSQYVKNIEEQLGVKLFDRNASPIRLTPAGEVYVNTAYDILNRWNQLDMQLTDITNLKRGRIVLGVSPFRSSFMMADTIAHFKKNYPHIDIYFVEGTISELEELMAKGRADMFVTTKPYEELLYDSVYICKENLLLALPPQHRVIEKIAGKGTESVDLRLFKNEPFVLLSQNQRLYNNSIRLCGNAGFEPQVSIQSRSIETVVAMVLAGLGCTFCRIRHQKQQ
jgi:DNA-binding transcriptional LysR family regulator